MPNEPGTLAGLMEDLEQLIEGFPVSPSDGVTWVNGGAAMTVIRKHKRAQWSIGTWGIPESPQKTNFVQNNTRLGLHFFEGTRAECQAWIDRKVNSDA